MKNIISAILFLTLSMGIFASETDENFQFGKVVNTEMENTLMAMERSGFEQELYDLKVKTIRLRVRASVGIEIPFIAKAKLRPEIEMFWSRKD